MNDRTMPTFQTCKQVAHMLGLGVSTLERMRSQGVGPHFIKLGLGKRARVVYDRRDIDSWLEAQKRKSTSEDALLRALKAEKKRRDDDEDSEPVA